MSEQEVRAQLAEAAAQPVTLQIAVVDDSTRPVTAMVTPVKPSIGMQHSGDTHAGTFAQAGSCAGCACNHPANQCLVSVLSCRIHRH